MRKRFYQVQGGCSDGVHSLDLPDHATNIADFRRVLFNQARRSLPPDVPSASALKVFTKKTTAPLRLATPLAGCGEDEDDPLIVRVSEVFFQLVQAEAPTTFSSRRVVSVPLHEESSAEDLQEIVFQSCFGDLPSHMIPAKLQVYENFKAYQANQSLDVWATLGHRGQTADKPLCVVVPPPVHPDEHSRFEVGSVSFSTNEYMEVNPPELVSFWSACAKDSTRTDYGNVLKLPEGAYLLGDPTLGSKVFLRRCYSELLDIGMKTLDEDEKSYPQLLILGNSGVGKTFFGFVLLSFLARSGATVVYESASMGDRILFAPGLVVRGSDQDFANILRTPTTYYIVDGGKPSHNPCMTVWLTTPQYSVSCLFGRVNALYMPTWSKEEILKCHESLYSGNIPIKKVEECYQRWGGIPRYVLHFAQSDLHQRLLQEAIASIRLNSLIGACVKFMQDGYYELHGLLHYRVNECYGKESFMFASRYVQQEVYKHLYRHDKDDLLWFIGKSHVGALAALHSLLVSEMTSGE